MKINIIKYRVVTDRYSGFECQIWKLWWPFWTQIDFVNTHCSKEAAIEYIEKHKRLKKLVVYQSE